MVHYNFTRFWYGVKKIKPYLIGDVISGIINCSKAAMPDFTEVVKQLIGVLGLEKCCHIWIFEAARPKKKKKYSNYPYYKKKVLQIH